MLTGNPVRLSSLSLLSGFRMGPAALKYKDVASTFRVLEVLRDEVA